MASEVPPSDLTEASVTLDPALDAFLRARIETSGRSIAGEIIAVLVEAMQAAEVPPPPTNARFVCSEELMAQKAECQDCHQAIRHNAKLWAERHVAETGHVVHVSLHFDMRGQGWQDRLSAERRAEIQEVQKPGVGQALAQSLLVKTKH